MEKNAALYDLTQQVQGAVFSAAFKEYLGAMTEEERAARPTPPPLLQLKGGYAESPAWVMVQIMEFAPEALTVEKFRRRAVYSSPGITAALLEMLASEKYLDRKGEGYVLTNAGRVIADRIRDNRIAPFAGFEPLPMNELTTLEALLWRVIKASLKSDVDTWSLVHSRNRAPAEDAPVVSKLVQYGSDFNAFRDDAHMAAYGKHDIEGYVWEAFAFVVTERAQNSRALYDALAYRGYYTEDWQAALNELTERGWIRPGAEFYAVTNAGKKVYDEVETATDQYFFAPWDILSGDEFKEVIHLLQNLLEAANEIRNSS